MFLTLPLFSYCLQLSSLSSVGLSKIISLYIYKSSEYKENIHLCVLSSSTSDSSSPQHPSHHMTNERSQPHCQSSISCSAQPQDDAGQQQNSSEQRRLPAPSSTTLSPVSSVDVLMGTAPFVPCGPGYTRPVRASPDSGSGRPGRLQAVSARSVRRHRLSLCLPCCLQTEDRWREQELLISPAAAGSYSWWSNWIKYLIVTVAGTCDRNCSFHVFYWTPQCMFEKNRLCWQCSLVWIETSLVLVWV